MLAEYIGERFSKPRSATAVSGSLVLQSRETTAIEMPSAGEADFCLLFDGLQKVRRLAGRDPPVFRFFAPFAPLR
jgi:hypothetical protein